MHTKWRAKEIRSAFDDLPKKENTQTRLLLTLKSATTGVKNDERLRSIQFKLFGFASSFIYFVFPHVLLLILLSFVVRCARCAFLRHWQNSQDKNRKLASWTASPASDMLLCLHLQFVLFYSIFFAFRSKLCIDLLIFLSYFVSAVLRHDSLEISNEYPTPTKELSKKFSFSALESLRVANKWRQMRWFPSVASYLIR